SRALRATESPIHPVPCAAAPAGLGATIAATSHDAERADRKAVPRHAADRGRQPSLRVPLGSRSRENEGACRLEHVASYRSEPPPLTDPQKEPHRRALHPV